MNRPNELDVVVLHGTVVAVYGDPPEAYEVEIVDPADGSGQFVTVKPEMIEGVLENRRG